MKQTKEASVRKSSTPHSVFRCLILGCVLIILNCYWIISAENRIVWKLTDFSIFPTVLFTLKCFFRDRSLSEEKMATTYVMISVATALAGHDIVQQLVPMMVNAFWYATPENKWEGLFFHFIPRWLTVDDRRILQGYFEGDANFWEIQYIEAWLIPILARTALVIVMLYTNIIIRKQRIEHEKLSYPLTVMPIEVIGNTSKLFSNKLIWLSFGIAFFGLEILAGINYLHPIVPALKIKHKFYFTEKPWNAIGRLPIYAYSFAIGFGYLMPLDLSLSLWFFYLFWKAQRVFSSAIGWTTAMGLQTEQRA